MATCLRCTASLPVTSETGCSPPIPPSHASELDKQERKWMDRWMDPWHIYCMSLEFWNHALAALHVSNLTPSLFTLYSGFQKLKYLQHKYCVTHVLQVLTLRIKNKKTAMKQSEMFRKKKWKNIHKSLKYATRTRFFITGLIKKWNHLHLDQKQLKLH